MIVKLVISWILMTGGTCLDMTGVLVEIGVPLQLIGILFLLSGIYSYLTFESGYTTNYWVHWDKEDEYDLGSGSWSDIFRRDSIVILIGDIVTGIVDAAAMVTEPISAVSSSVGLITLVLNWLGFYFTDMNNDPDPKNKYSHSAPGTY